LIHKQKMTKNNHKIYDFRENNESYDGALSLNYHRAPFCLKTGLVLIRFNTVHKYSRPSSFAVDLSYSTKRKLDPWYLCTSGNVFSWQKGNFNLTFHDLIFFKDEKIIHWKKLRQNKKNDLDLKVDIDEWALGRQKRSRVMQFLPAFWACRS